MAILTDIPEGAQVIDLAAARAARAEARSEKSFIKLSAGYIEVNAELPLETADAFLGNRIRDGISYLLTDPTDVDVLYKEGISAEDLQVIIEFVSGKTLGELQASQKS